MFTSAFPLAKDIKNTLNIFFIVIYVLSLQVDCDAIFASDEIDRPSEVPPTPWEQIPELLQVNPERKASGSLADFRHGLKGVA